MFELLGAAGLGGLACVVVAYLYHGRQERAALLAANVELMKRIITAEAQYTLARADLADFLAKPVMAVFSDEQVRAFASAVASQVTAAPISRVN